MCMYYIYIYIYIHIMYVFHCTIYDDCIWAAIGCAPQIAWPRNSPTSWMNPILPPTIYIYIISLSLSLYIYIYIYIYMHMYILRAAFLTPAEAEGTESNHDQFSKAQSGVSNVMGVPDQSLLDTLHADPTCYLPIIC